MTARKGKEGGRKCRHRESEMRHRCLAFDGERMNCMTWRACVDCGAWLPLGPANDEPEAVKVEMRAAEIADDLTDADRLCDWTLANETFMSFTSFEERRGWSVAESNMQHHSSAWLAGYLARVIVEHGEKA